MNYFISKMLSLNDEQLKKLFYGKRKFAYDMA